MSAGNEKHDRNGGGTEPVPEGKLTHDPDAPAGRLEEERVTPEWTHADFMDLPIERLAERVGLTPPPSGATPEEEKEWREKAWQNHVQDLQNRDEWGTATQATEPPTGDDPNL